MSILNALSALSIPGDDARKQGGYARRPAASASTGRKAGEVLICPAFRRSGDWCSAQMVPVSQEGFPGRMRQVEAHRPGNRHPVGQPRRGHFGSAFDPPGSARFLYFPGLWRVILDSCHSGHSCPLARWEKPGPAFRPAPPESTGRDEAGGAGPEPKPGLAPEPGNDKKTTPAATMQPRTPGQADKNERKDDKRLAGETPAEGPPERRDREQVPKPWPPPDGEAQGRPPDSPFRLRLKTVQGTTGRKEKARGLRRRP